ncbi:MAG: Hsp20/alpha crystallin family protein [Absicoccus sp.]|uniref:Hsp20/alpha crystallin family protein n=1 Tax=Absicoccus sp. TaxID=2718527 RepID=UPI002A74A656|nr:Hsp20/alpha crystallin family protein [Absicoccus sp.]MDY3036423.1 Hsp20/alpha crystallin family protein [Absicoccus sp.]
MTYYPGFGRVFDDFFNGGFTNQAGVLKTDIVEKDGNYVLSMEVPGYKKEDIQIELSDGYLKVTATKQSSTDDKDDQGRIVRKERYSGTQSRSFYVGDNYHQQDIKASFDNGELTITLPTEAKKIEDTKQYISIE